MSEAPARAHSLGYCDRLGIWIEHHPCFATLEMGEDLGHLLVQCDVPIAVVGSLAEHVALDDPAQRLRGQFGIGDLNRFLTGLGLCLWRCPWLRW